MYVTKLMPIRIPILYTQSPSSISWTDCNYANSNNEDWTLTVRYLQILLVRVSYSVEVPWNFPPPTSIFHPQET